MNSYARKYRDETPHPCHGGIVYREWEENVRNPRFYIEYRP